MTQLTLEEELTLLYCWTTGNYREDMRHFEETLFHYSKAFKKIKDGATLTQIIASAEEINLPRLEFLQAESTKMFYYGARATALKFQQESYICKLNNAKSEDVQTYIDKITAVQNFIDSREYQPKCSNFADAFFTELNYRQNEKNPKYGLKQLDKETGGLHRGQLVVLGARPGCGKSALALQIANGVINEGYKVMYIPLEMTEYETLQRMIIQEQIVYDSKEAENPTEEQKEDIKKFLDSVESSGNFAMFYGLNAITGIEKKIKEEKPFLVVVDQLTQVEPVGKAKDIRDKYIQITNALKRIALNENVCILAIHQLNRPAESQKNLNLSNLAESDSVGRDADVVLMLHADDEEDFASLKRTNLFIVKNRQGRAGERILLQFNGERYTFCETAPSAYEKYVNR